MTDENAPDRRAVDVVFQAPRQQGAVEAYGYGFGSWDVSIVGSLIVCTTTVPAHSSSSTPWIGYFTRTPPASEVLVGTVSPAATPATPTVSLTFT